MRSWGRVMRFGVACCVLLLGVAVGSSDSDDSAPAGPTGALGVAMQCVFADGNQTSCALEAEALISQLAILVSAPDQFEAQFLNADSDLLSQMCAAGSCIPTLNAAAQATHASLLAAQGSDDACGPTSQLGEAASTMVGLLGLVTDFLCLVSAEGLPCITAVVEAIQDAGMNGILTGHATVDSSSQMAELMALSKGCTAFANAGCCAQSFFDTITAYQQLTCLNSTKETELLMMLPKTCGTVPGIGNGPLEPSCPGYAPQSYTQYAPTDCPPRSSAGEFWAEIVGTCEADSDLSTLGCASDMCELGCLSVSALLDAEGPIMESNTVLSVGGMVAASGVGPGSDTNTTWIFRFTVVGLMVVVAWLFTIAPRGRAADYGTTYKNSAVNPANPSYGAADEEHTPLVDLAGDEVPASQPV